jgi:hypothetical protein
MVQLTKAKIPDSHVLYCSLKKEEKAVLKMELQLLVQLLDP